VLEKDIVLSFDDKAKLLALYGEREQNLRIIEEEYGIEIYARANSLRLVGLKEKVESVEALINTISSDMEDSLKKRDIKSLIKLLSSSKLNIENIINKDIVIKTRKKSIVPLNSAQLEYISLLQSKEIVLAAGPAGTGKTYLAVAVGVHFFLARKVDKIILSRPAIEAGEKIGYLPGNIQEKIDPYLKPLYDALHDMIDGEHLKRFLEEGTIEIAPLAFMRGRTLSNAFIILDEAQNTTISQMKMFLTRLGINSHMIICGDPSQTDLPKTLVSGMGDAIQRLQRIKEIGFQTFSQEDIIRNNLTAKIIQAYESNR
jgi:phosphate starvation-inducible PhoH-like protein